MSIISIIIWSIIIGLTIMGFFLTPIIIGKFILGFDTAKNGDSWNFICILWIVFSYLIHSKYGVDTKKSDEIIKVYCIIGIFSSSIFFLNGYISSSTQKAVSNAPTASYHAHREYSPNYSYNDTHSNSNYHHFEPTYTEPTKIPDDDVIPYSPQIKNEEIVEMEPLITPKNDKERNNQSFSEPSAINLEEISPPSSEIGISDSWEYVMSDEQGNKYYINKNFGVFSTVTSIEGNVFSASFRKVLSDGGREVEVPAYDINRGMITEKKIVAYEESIIRFRNEAGIKEFSFSAISGYTSENSIIIGYGIANVDNILKWHPINDKVYDALYNSAYKNLRR